MIDELIQLLELQPHPEGGFFRETYRCADSVSGPSLPERYGAEQTRSVSTAIYYMLTENNFSTMHRVQSDEIYHFYLGSPLEMLLLYESGSSEIIHIGSDVTAGQRPQFVIPRGVWQGSRVLSPGKFALVGATVAPGFDFADFEEGTRSELGAKYPDRFQLIQELTRK